MPLPKIIKTWKWISPTSITIENKSMLTNQDIVNIINNYINIAAVEGVRHFVEAHKGKYFKVYPDPWQPAVNKLRASSINTCEFPSSYKPDASVRLIGKTNHRSTNPDRIIVTLPEDQGGFPITSSNITRFDLIPGYSSGSIYTCDWTQLKEECKPPVGIETISQNTVSEEKILPIKVIESAFPTIDSMIQYLGFKSVKEYEDNLRAEKESIL